MTKEEEAAVKGTIDNLLRIVTNMQEEMALMSEAFVQLEKRLNAVEGKGKPSKLLLPPGLARN